MRTKKKYEISIDFSVKNLVNNTKGTIKKNCKVSQNFSN